MTNQTPTQLNIYLEEFNASETGEEPLANAREELIPKDMC